MKITVQDQSTDYEVVNWWYSKITDGVKGIAEWAECECDHDETVATFIRDKSNKPIEIVDIYCTQCDNRYMTDEETTRLINTWNWDKTYEDYATNF